jgi:leucyl-tRNA synthetase
MKRLWTGSASAAAVKVVRKEKSQWMLGITKYAQRLIDDLVGLDFI